MWVILGWYFPFEKMQILSLITSAAPKAQHEPHEPWSLISNKDSHYEYWSRKSKCSGRSLRGVMSLMFLLRFEGGFRTPIK